ncbi:pentapeptide repeat-containing protein [Enterobacter huaxiensis]|uniref:pentapeptide repeat-containing protein n=1 Tax=Enterobacter huaxiensis TaxID=2494702 RepID=UPI0021DAB6CC|nr:pentapeptide repeat-containing protein [Enterobacter huaxiensis]
MSNLSISPSNLLAMSSAAGTGIDSEIKKMTSPKNILESIINFFTFGGVTRDNNKTYRHIIELMQKALTNISYECGIETNKHLYLDDVNGCKISFKPNYANEELISLEVRKGNYTESCDIDAKRFTMVCRALKIRSMLHISQDPTPLTERGKINLTGVDLSQTDLSGMELSNVDFTDSVLFRTNLSNANLTNSVFSNANLKHSIFSGADASHSLFSGADASNSVFLNTNLDYADISNSDFSNANMKGAELTHTDASFTNLSYANLLDADVSHINLTCAKLKNTIVEIDFLGDARKFPGAEIDSIKYVNTSSRLVGANST